MNAAQRRRWIACGLLTRDGQELTETGERAAEYAAECRAGWWDLPERFDPPAVDAPDPYPNGSIV